MFLGLKFLQDPRPHWTNSVHKNKDRTEHWLYKTKKSPIIRFGSVRSGRFGSVQFLHTHNLDHFMYRGLNLDYLLLIMKKLAHC